MCSSIYFQGGFDDNYGLGPEHGFGQRIYRCLVGGKGVAYRHTPKFENKVSPVCLLIYLLLAIGEEEMQFSEGLWLRESGQTDSIEGGK